MNAKAPSIPIPRVRGGRLIAVAGTFGLIITGFIVLPIFAAVGTSSGGAPAPRVAVVIEDDAGWLAIFTEVLQGAGFTVQPCPTFCDHPSAVLFIVDGLDPNGVVVGPGYVRTLRAAHPGGTIIGKSSFLGFRDAGTGQTLEALFLAAGANAVWETTADLDDLQNLFP